MKIESMLARLENGEGISLFKLSDVMPQLPGFNPFPRFESSDGEEFVPIDERMAVLWGVHSGRLVVVVSSSKNEEALIQPWTSQGAQNGE